jgi:hypothetical protein
MSLVDIALFTLKTAKQVHKNEINHSSFSCSFAITDIAGSPQRKLTESL